MNDLKSALRKRLQRPGFAALVAALSTAAPLHANACTIFVLTDPTRALFFNNDDWFLSDLDFVCDRRGRILRVPSVADPSNSRP